MSFLDALLQRRLVGLDVGVSGIKAVELQGSSRPRLVAYNRVPLPWNSILPDGVIQDREAVIKALKKLFETSTFSSKRVAIGASGNSVITKRVTLPQMSPAELEHQLYFEAEQYIPFNLDEVNLDFAVLGGDKVGEDGNPLMEVLLVAAKKEYIQGLNQIIQEAGLIPEVVDIQAFALGNTFEFNYGHLIDMTPGTASVILDFGAGSTKISVVEGDKTTFTRELRQCGTSCTALLSQQLGVPLEDAESFKLSHAQDPKVKEVVDAHVSDLTEEISRTLDYCTSQGTEKSITGVYVCGGASKTQGLLGTLEKRMPATVQELNPIQNIAGSGKKMNVNAIKELSYLGAVAIGLAMRMAGDS